MSMTRLEGHYLSSVYWLRRTVIPTIALAVIFLSLFGWLLRSHEDLDEIAVIIGFFSFYFIAFKGGHLYMIRDMHLQLKKEFAGVYPKAVTSLPAELNQRELGAALARIKAELYRRIK